MTETLETIIARWNANEGKPYKGSLIDWSAYDGDGEQPPENIGCMCAQGQVLHLLGGWSPRRLHDVDQDDADRETADLLGISIAHSILLRSVNDSVDGAPSIVLTNPEKVLGDQAHIVLAAWRHLDRMTEADWQKAESAAAESAESAAAESAESAESAAWSAGSAARSARSAWSAARSAARSAAWSAAESAAWSAADKVFATTRKRLQKSAIGLVERMCALSATPA